MKKLLTAAACALLALPALSVADDDWHGPPPHGTPPAWHGGPGHYDRDDHRGPFPYRWGPRPYGYGVPRAYGYGVPRAYGPPPRPYYYGYGGHGHHDHDNDDPAWALGGFILGAIVGNVAAQQDHPPKAQPQSAPVCYDTVAYDSSGTPYVKRDCR